MANEEEPTVPISDHVEFIKKLNDGREAPVLSVIC